MDLHVLVDALLLVDRAVAVVFVLHLQYFEPSLHCLEVVVDFLEFGGRLSWVLRLGGPLFWPGALGFGCFGLDAFHL